MIPLNRRCFSITKIHGGAAYNVIPSEVSLSGGVRYFNRDVGATVAAELTRIANGCAATYGMVADVDIRNVFDVTINDERATAVAAGAAGQIVGVERVSTTPAPSMGSEDFSDKLAVVPGAYIFLGHQGTMTLHHPGYWFDDDLISVAVSILARIIESRKD